MLALGLLWLWLRYGTWHEPNKSNVEHLKKLVGKDHQSLDIFVTIAPSNPELDDELKLLISASTYLAVTDGPQLTSHLTRISDSLKCAQIEVAALDTFVWALDELLALLVL